MEYPPVNGTPHVNETPHVIGISHVNGTPHVIGISHVNGIPISEWNTTCEWNTHQ